MIEYSKGSRNPESVWATAPRWAVLKENARRSANSEPELRCSGLADSECSDTQLQYNEEVEILDRVDLARCQAKLLELKAKLQR